MGNAEWIGSYSAAEIIADRIKKGTPPKFEEFSTSWACVISEEKTTLINIAPEKNTAEIILCPPEWEDTIPDDDAISKAYE